MNNQNTPFWWIALPMLFIATVGFTLSLAKDGKNDGDNDDNEYIDTTGSVVTLMPPSANDSLFALINARFQAVKPAFEKSCFDCHSNKTHFPWYYEIPGIKGMIDEDIKDGRKNVDFSKDFPFTGKGTQADMLTEIRSEISEGAMPPLSYRIIHWGRLIEPPLKDTVIAWIDNSLARLATVGIVPAKKEAEEDE
jgi:hypothetical protein